HPIGLARLELTGPPGADQVLVCPRLRFPEPALTDAGEPEIAGGAGVGRAQRVGEQKNNRQAKGIPCPTARGEWCEHGLSRIGRGRFFGASVESGRCLGLPAPAPSRSPLSRLT